MKIVKIETFKVVPRWLFVRVEADNGLVGWGEPVVEGKAATTEACVHELGNTLIGEDPTKIENIWQTLYRGGFYRGGPILTSAISGIDQALWDIKGKFHNLPVYEFFGGNVRNKMEIYSWIDSNTPKEAASSAKKRYEQGFTKVKMFGTEKGHWYNDYDQIDLLISKVDAIRSELGNKIGIAIDFHGRAHKSMAKTLIKELEKYNILFIEEPVLIENEEAFKDLHNYSAIPLATGERNFTRWDFKKMLSEGYVDIIQPDLSHAGGISEVRKIATMAEAYDVGLAPHCPLGPVALASCLQIDFCSINACFQEQSLGMAYNNGNEMGKYIKDSSTFEYDKGYVNLFKKPGLGVEVNETSIREMAKKGHNWKNVVLYNQDGSISEW